MTHRIILFMPLFNRGGHRFIFHRLFPFQIEGFACDFQRSRHLAFVKRGREVDTTAAPVLPLSCGLYFLNSPEAFLVFRSAPSMRR